MLQKIIKKKLSQIFIPTYLEILNESYRHSVPVGSESHFKVIIVSDLFIGQSLLERHRAIYKALKLELSKNMIHALELNTYTLKEWSKVNHKFISL